MALSHTAQRATDPLLSPAQVRHMLERAKDGAGPAVRLLDVRWRLDLPEGRPAYVQAHLPGAVYVDLERDLARRGQPEEGKYPLPTRADLEESARRWGINPGDVVVAYDDNQSVAAARAWWLLSTAGVDVRVLDGGIRAWVADGFTVESGDIRPAAGAIALNGFEDVALGIDAVAVYARDAVLLDVRTPEQYTGVRQGQEAVGGHIPGAINLPALAVIDGEGKIRSASLLRQIFASAHVREGSEVAVYCGAGVAAMHTALALRRIGVEAHVYAGSWSQWANTRGRPVAVGILPHGRLISA